LGEEIKNVIVESAVIFYVVTIRNSVEI